MSDRLTEHGGRIVTVGGSRVVEMRDPNDNSRSIYQYRLAGDGIERRRLAHDGQPFRDGSPWEPCDAVAMWASRGTYHPIIDELVRYRQDDGPL